MLPLHWPMMLTLHDFIQTQHPLIQKVGMGLTMAGSGVSLTAATQFKNVAEAVDLDYINVLGLDATLDEWKVYGIVFGVAFGLVGIAIQVVGVVLTQLHRRRKG